MREKIHSYLGFAKRSRSIFSGYNSCMDGVLRKKVYLLILTKDLTENTTKNLIKLATTYKVPVRVYGTKESVSLMAGENGRGIFGITNKNLAAAIMGEIDRDGQNA
jgi:ribosomal protein L7Ae-like RNA K-turn-binding protein